MACILLVDPSEVASRALGGILTHAKHRMATVKSAGEAWDFIRRNVKVDLVFTEVALEGEDGLGLVKRLKRDPLLKALPVVVYTDHGDRSYVRAALDLQVQNFLIKPYRDDLIYAEIARALTEPWRLHHFIEEKSFCKTSGLSLVTLSKQRDDLRVAMEVGHAQLVAERENRSARQVTERLAVLADQAKAVGAPGVVEFLGALEEIATRESWMEFEASLETMTFGSHLIFRHLNASLIPEGFMSPLEANAESEAREVARWSVIPEPGKPIVSWAQLQKQVEALPGCPIIDSVAAAFQMTASGHPSSISPLLDLVEKDPGLSAQLLIAANKVKARGEIDPTPIEDPRLAVGVLGELRLSNLARSAVTAEEHKMTVPPHFNWSQFWMFQLGTARMARFTCHYLELYHMEGTAYVAGLLHDLGKLLLLHLHPIGLQTILKYVHTKKVPLADAEKLFLGCTTSEIAAHFAEKNGFARAYIDVMRWIAAPAESPENTMLVAVVSLARDLCRHNKVGDCGDLPREKLRPLEDTPEWAVLQESVFPSFNLREFEQKVHANCRELKLELYGRTHKGTLD